MCVCVRSQALDEEKVVYERSSSKNIYLNVAVNTLKKLRSNITTPSSPVASTSRAIRPLCASLRDDGVNSACVCVSAPQRALRSGWGGTGRP